MGLPEGLALGLSLLNKTGDPLWVEVAFECPEAAQSCRRVERLEQGGSHLFTCPQRDLTADVDYLIHIRVYADAALTRLVESPETKFRFDQRSIEAFQRIAR